MQKNVHFGKLMLQPNQFFMQRRQILKALGIGAAAAALSSLHRLICWIGLKATIVHQHPQAKRSNLQSPGAGKTACL